MYHTSCLVSRSANGPFEDQYPKKSAVHRVSRYLPQNSQVWHTRPFPTINSTFLELPTPLFSIPGLAEFWKTYLVLTVGYLVDFRFVVLFIF